MIKKRLIVKYISNYLILSAFIQIQSKSFKTLNTAVSVAKKPNFSCSTTNTNTSTALIQR